MDDPNQKSRVTIVVKAAPRVGKTHGELVCCAGIDPNGKWVRLYPVSFRTLDDAQKFGRWDIVSYSWRRADDHRSESRRIDHHSLEIVGSVRDSQRQTLVAPHVVKSLVAETASGRSLAFIRPQSPEFFYEKKDADTLAEEAALFANWHKAESEGLFGFAAKKLVPYEPAKYRFGYNYITSDGPRRGTCQDWEIEATFNKWSREYGEAAALSKIEELFGVEYPKRGFVLAMGTHKAYPQWLINGVIRLDHGREDEVAATLF